MGVGAEIVCVSARHFSAIRGVPALLSVGCRVRFNSIPITLVRTALNSFLRYVVHISLEFDRCLSFLFISDG